MTPAAVAILVALRAGVDPADLPLASGLTAAEVLDIVNALQVLGLADGGLRLSAEAVRLTQPTTAWPARLEPSLQRVMADPVRDDLKPHEWAMRWGVPERIAAQAVAWGRGRNNAQNQPADG